MPKRRSASAPSSTSRMPGCIWTERYMSSVKHRVPQPLKTTIPRRTRSRSGITHGSTCKRTGSAPMQAALSNWISIPPRPMAGRCPSPRQATTSRRPPSRPTGPAGVTPSSPRPIRGIPPPSTASGYMPAGVTAGLPIKTETTPSSGQTGHTADTPAPPPPAPPRSRSTFPRTTATAAPAPASTSSSTPRTDGTATRRCSTGR